jgi:hypothetical protein
MRALYRQCVRLVNLLIGDNDCDERDFGAEREADERRNQPPSSPEDDRPLAKGRRRRMSMATHVDSENKLQLRAEYYRMHTREDFDGYYG